MSEKAACTKPEQQITLTLLTNMTGTEDDINMIKWLFKNDIVATWQGLHSPNLENR